MKVRTMRTAAFAAALVLSSACGVTACSSDSEKTEPSATMTSSTAATTTSSQSTSTASSSSDTSTSANSTPANSTSAGSTSAGSTAGTSQPSASPSHASGQSHSPRTGGVAVTSTSYLNGAYEILITTPPGASFMFAPTVGKPSACTIVQRKPKGILTTHLVHCVSERVDKATLQVTYAATPSDAPVVVPLVTTGA